MSVLKTTALLSCFFFLISCGSKDNDLVRRFANEKKILDCKMEYFKMQNDSLWDAMGAFLEQNVPADVPAAERQNLVTTRNAYVITRFRVFPTLDSAIRKRVHDADIMDKDIAEGIKVTRNKIQDVENEMNNILQKIEGKSEQRYRQLKEELHALEEKPCAQ